MYGLAEMTSPPFTVKHFLPPLRVRFRIDRKSFDRYVKGRRIFSRSGLLEIDRASLSQSDQGVGRGHVFNREKQKAHSGASVLKKRKEKKKKWKIKKKKKREKISGISAAYARL